MANGSTIKVLLVEDSHSYAAIIERWLVETQPSHRFKTSHADSLETAKMALRHDHFDVVLLDLALPDSTGLDTVRAVQAAERRVPVIVLTGSKDEELAVTAVNSGAQDFLVKGEFDEHVLRRSIRYSIERHRLEQDRKLLSSQLLTAVKDEQQRIARDLHDGVAQALSGLNMMTRSLARRLGERKLSEADKAHQISSGIQEVLDSFRHVLSGLSPVDVDGEGLRVALLRLCEQFREQSNTECEFRCDEEFRLSDNTAATHLFRIAQESLTNTRKHAEASRVELRLERVDQKVVLQISDDGKGFDSSTAADQGMGLRILRHRSDLIGGNLDIQSGRAGTRVRCELESHGSRLN